MELANAAAVWNEVSAHLDSVLLYSISYYNTHSYYKVRELFIYFSIEINSWKIEWKLIYNRSKFIKSFAICLKNSGRYMKNLIYKIIRSFTFNRLWLKPT